MEQFENNIFDVIVIGGGHAGIEAANAAAEFGHRVAIISIPGVGLASTPCNPAVGGVGKGQVVREIDALGGLMGHIADLSGIQFRALNDSKGYAVRSTRIQVDKEKYTQNAEKLISEHPLISVIRDKVQNIESVEKGFKIITQDMKTYHSMKVVVTTGTFLAGNLHMGPIQTKGGRIDSQASVGLMELFKNVKTLKKRFKTGTPPRILKKTVDISKMEIQESDPEVKNFHWSHPDNKRFINQVSCYLTRTNPSTLKIIRENKEKSPIYNGQIKGVGPRYCPSIEDKAFRYEDRDTHHVFIEPEGLDLDTIYPNGVSTSLPKEIQLEFIRTISGLENAEIKIFGHAVEYDVLDTTQLDGTLEHKEIRGLYFAGQVNGTSGYEEAAGQGIVAGINAGLSLLPGNKKMILNRHESYIGVMIEDLVTNYRDEPYRLFTARSENRLSIREDNTINRIYPYRKSLGLNKEIDKYQEKYIEQWHLLNRLSDKKRYLVNDENKKYFLENEYGELNENILLSELLKRAQLDPYHTLKKEISHFGAEFLDDVIYSVAITKKYEGYIKRSEVDFDRIKRLGEKPIDWMVLSKNPNISNECRQRILSIKPQFFSHLRNIEGIRPATLAYVAGNIL